MTISDCLLRVESALSDIRALLEGGQPVPVPAPGPAPAPAPPTSGDAFDFAAAVQHDGTTFTGWPATATITALEFRSDGVHVEFSKHDGPDRWPDVRPDGWDGDLQYCMGMAMHLDGVWHVSAPIQCWHDLVSSGGNIGDATAAGGRGQVAGNWFYSDRWGPLCRQPQAGEMVGFFVVAGSVRGGSEAISVRERSNVVVVPFPTADGASHSF